MKARSREINIFNMSLLDILCGALGAFCFMMLTLFPYYTRAKSGGGGSASTQNELRDAQQQIEKLKRQLPVTLQIWWFADGQDVDLYLWRPAEPKAQPQPDVQKKQGIWISGDAATECNRGPCSESWQMRDMPIGLEAKIYYILHTGSPVLRPTVVSAALLTPSGVKQLPMFLLDPARRMAMVGTITRVSDTEVRFSQAIPSIDQQGGQAPPPPPQRRP
jgi:hypothetical protein